MNRTHLFIALGLGLGGTAAASCVQTSYVLDPTHCAGAQNGDSFCAEQHPDGSRPYCRLGSNACNPGADPDIDGCEAERPQDECYSPCGRENAFPDDASCLDDETTVADGTTSSTGGETEEPPTSTTEPETDTEDPSTTTGPECSETIPCLDMERPFCVDGTCSTCDASIDPTPDEACASLDVGLPLCVGTECVQCSAENASACEDTTPLCDDATNTCVGCSFHEECQDIGSPACNIETGACFDPAAVTPVNLSGANALQNAVNGVADGAEHTIIVTGSTASTHSAVIDGGKTIAIVSTDTSIQAIRGAGGSPTLTVIGAGSTAYLHRVRLEDSNDVGVSVASGGTLYADNTQVVGNDGGGIELAAGTSGFLRNCMVAGANNADAISSNGATMELLYTTAVGNFGASAALACTGGSVEVRNGILVSRGAEAVSCTATISNTFEAQGAGYDEGWFNLDGGDLSLIDGADFADVAVWENGDPPFDFEGDPRPATDGASDFAGADTVP